MTRAGLIHAGGWLSALALSTSLAQAPSHLEACESRLRANQPAVAEAICRQAMAHYERIGDMAGHYDSALRLVDSLIATDRHQQGLDALHQLEQQMLPDHPVDQRYRLLRKRGSIYFHQENHMLAMAEFEQGLALAVALGDKLKIGKSHNDLGAAYRAQGLYRESLSHLLNSLHYKKLAGDDHAIATTINNIGNVYRDMGECASALEQYHQAIRQFEQVLASDKDDQRSLLNIAHTQENIGLCHAALGDRRRSIQNLNASLSAFRDFERHVDQMRLHLSLARVHIDNGETKLATAQLEATERLAHRDQLELRMDYYALLAQVADLDENYQAMLDAADSGYSIATEVANDARRSAFAQQQAAAYAGLQHYTMAYQRLVQHQALSRQVMRAKFDQDLARNRTLFDLQSREEKITSLRKDLQIQSLEQRQWLLLIAIIGVTLSTLLVSFWLRRSRQQKRLRERIEKHRQREAALRLSQQRLTDILDASSEPMVVVDQSNRLVFVNRAFDQYSGLSRADILGKAATEIFPGLLGQAAFQALSVEGDEAIIPDLEIRALPSRASLVTAHFLVQADGSIVVSLRIGHSVEAELLQANLLRSLKQLHQVKEQLAAVHSHLPSVHPQSEQGQVFWTQLNALSAKMETLLGEADVRDIDNQYRAALVALMTATLECWEQATGQSKLELAEQSGIWRISIDDGRLRTRSLDRYYSLNKLPRNPRWREVMRTTHYVLANCELAPASEQRLTQLLARFESLQQARL